MSVSRSLLIVLLALPAAPAFAEPPKGQDKPKGPVSYYREVRRVFQQHCQGCHQPAKAQGGYAMTTYATLLKPGDTGKAPIVPGHPGKSELLSQVLPAADKKAAMPKNREPLPAAEIDLVRRW